MIYVHTDEMQAIDAVMHEYKTGKIGIAAAVTEILSIPQHPDPDLRREVGELRIAVDALAPPETLMQVVEWVKRGSGAGEYYSLPDFPPPPMDTVGWREALDELRECALDFPQNDAEPPTCTIVITLLTDACLYTYHLETAYGTFVGKPVVLPYAMDGEPPPSIITADMIGEVITPLVDMGEVHAREAADTARAWTGAEKDRPLVKDEGVARLLEGGEA